MEEKRIEREKETVGVVFPFLAPLAIAVTAR